MRMDLLKACTRIDAYSAILLIVAIAVAVVAVATIVVFNKNFKATEMLFEDPDIVDYFMNKYPDRDECYIQMRLLDIEPLWKKKKILSQIKQRQKNLA